MAYARWSTPIQLEELGRFFDFSQEDMDEILKRVRKSRVKPGMAANPSRTPPKDAKGWPYVNARRLMQFVTLKEHRGGFSEGCRNRAALIYARLLSKCLNLREELVPLIEGLGAECHPPLRLDEVNSAIESGTKPMAGSITTATISEWLEISHDEHLHLKSKFGRSAWKPYRVPPPKPFELRRREILRIAGKKKIPSIRAMAELLKKSGFPVSATMVAKDYRVLKIAPHQKRMRDAAPPKKRSRSSP